MSDEDSEEEVPAAPREDEVPGVDPEAGGRTFRVRCTSMLLTIAALGEGELTVAEVVGAIKVVHPPSYQPSYHCYITLTHHSQVTVSTFRRDGQPMVVVEFACGEEEHESPADPDRKRHIHIWFKVHPNRTHINGLAPT